MLGTAAHRVVEALREARIVDVSPGEVTILRSQPLVLIAYALSGLLILFGSGGVMVEVYGDRALALPPLNTTLAQRMMEQTRIFAALKGVRGRPPVNLAALEETLVRFSQAFVVRTCWSQEFDEWLRKVDSCTREALPDCLEVTCSTADAVIMGLKLKGHETWGVQFHPESILTRQGRDLLRNFLDLCGI